VKIAHLSTGISGGAAVTARTLAGIQRKFGYDVQTFTREKKFAQLASTKSKISTFVSLANATKEYAQVTHFSSLSADLEQIRSFKPDVIFIHNWFNLLRERDIVSLSHEFPIVFVAHDARLATGGCHVTLGCENFKTGCRHCPATRVDWIASSAKRSIDSMVNQLGEYAVISPSNWLMNEISDSPIISKARISKVIANPSEAFEHIQENQKKISAERFKIIFVAASLNSKYKGLDILIESLSLIEPFLERTKFIDVSVIGDGKSRNDFPSESKVKYTYLGKLNSIEVHHLIRESDLLVVPSRSENFPGVIGEAQLLGCTVAASNLGGIPEMIEEGVSGFLFEPTAQECMKAIMRAINTPNLDRVKKTARERALVRHDSTRINLEYEIVIKELLKS